MAEPNEPTPSQPVISYQSPGIVPHRWKTIWHAANPMEANLAVGKLQERGLHARVDFENTAALGFDAYAPGGMAVQVLEEEFAEARIIIDEIEQRRRSRLQAHSVSCPHCGTPGARRALHPMRKIGLAMGLIGMVLEGFAASPLMIPIPMFLPLCVGLCGIVLIFWPMQPYWRCVSCAQRFHAPEPKAQEEDDEDEIDSETEEDDKNEDDDIMTKPKPPKAS